MLSCHSVVLLSYISSVWSLFQTHAFTYKKQQQKSFDVYDEEIECFCRTTILEKNIQVSCFHDIWEVRCTTTLYAGNWGCAKHLFRNIILCGTCASLQCVLTIESSEVFGVIPETKMSSDQFMLIPKNSDYILNMKPSDTVCIIKDRLLCDVIPTALSHHCCNLWMGCNSDIKIHAASKWSASLIG